MRDGSDQHAKGVKLKRLRRIAWNGLAALFVLLCAAIIVSWIHSAHRVWAHSLNVWGARYRFTSNSAQLFVDGPPTADDPVARQIAAEMSNDDFAWNQKPTTNAAGSPVITADVRPQSPTWRMYQHFRQELVSSSGLDAGVRVWLAALEDPKKYLPAELLLSLAAGKWRTAQVSDSGVDALTVSADPVTGKPDLSVRQLRRDEWHDRFDIRRGTFPYGFLLAIGLIIPVIRFSQPAARHRNLYRWLFNAAALGSFCLALLFAAELIISYGPGEQIELRNETIPPPFAGGYYSTAQMSRPYMHFIWLESYRGRAQWLERDVPQSGGPTRAAVRMARPVILDLPGIYRGSGVRVTRQWSLPGISLYDQPNQILAAPANGRPLPWGARGPAEFPASRSITVSWWFALVAALALPAIWMTTTVIRVRRTWRARGAHLCPKCFYDLRATPDRCPECGTQIVPGAKL